MSRNKITLSWLFSVVSVGFTASTHAGDPPGWPPAELNTHSNTSVIVAIVIVGLIILIGFWRRRK